MTPRYIRNEPGPREDAAAALASGLVAATLGVVLFYVVRLLLARDEVEDPPEGASDG